MCKRIGLKIFFFFNDVILVIQKAISVYKDYYNKCHIHVLLVISFVSALNTLLCGNLVFEELKTTIAKRLLPISLVYLKSLLQSIFGTELKS